MTDQESKPRRKRSLKLALQKWIENKGLAQDTMWGPEQPDEPHSGPDLVLMFEGDLHSVLWRRPFEGHDASHSSRLREEFDAIVRQHGFFFDFKNEVTGHLYDRAETDRIQPS